ncbi:hypothetical protein FD19_GL000919 [Lacticaseibacillus thailandensis DSM 22698 = JCM 13996]|uniref:Uncharacterized protein n=1 Tax=Lacticaseibacillus thailandensis DSM 22698 = JCM 13996 TaxID=1423810 RepID=A0A0R2C7A1_9LACO|nr:hypothetical protein FD19_GL000919 [Lacticaseibacillus thailandensis DSM 22698 = JCM 13996]
MTILPFCTHAGSRFGTSLTTIRRLCPMAVVAMGLPVRGDRVDQAGCAVTHWLREADLTSGR